MEGAGGGSTARSCFPSRRMADCQNSLNTVHALSPQPAGLPGPLPLRVPSLGSPGPWRSHICRRCHTGFKLRSVRLAVTPASCLPLNEKHRSPRRAQPAGGAHRWGREQSGRWPPASLRCFCPSETRSLCWGPAAWTSQAESQRRWDKCPLCTLSGPAVPGSLSLLLALWAAGSCIICLAGGFLCH